MHLYWKKLIPQRVVDSNSHKDMTEEERQEALQKNYELGKYGEKFCERCGYLIENYADIKSGLCEECREETDNY